MSRSFLSSLWLTPAFVGATAFAAIAQTPAVPNNPSASSANEGQASTMEQVITYTENTGKTRIGQVTSVSQLTDVKPTDWAFQALQSLVERYGCIVGYPDKKYRGNQALTRYEFAAGLNACMNRINELIASATADLVKKEDLDALKRLQEEFAAELAELRGRIDALDVRVGTLEKQQFSTTAKLNAEVILAPAFIVGSDKPVNSNQQRAISFSPFVAPTIRNNIFGASPSARTINDNVIFADRVRLNIDASFNGKDRLRTTLQARNFTPFSGAGISNTNQTRLGFDGSNTNAGGNDFQLRRIEYRFPIGELTQVFVGGGTNDGLEFNDSIPTFNPLLDSSGQGSISRFGRFNPIYRVGTGTGIIINQKLGREYTFGNNFNLSVGYLVPTVDASDPSVDRGLFKGSYAALAQLAYTSRVFSVGFTYANAYYNNGQGLTGGTGTGFANNPFNSTGTIPGATAGTLGNVPVSTNSFGLQGSVRIAPWLVVSGWGGYTRAEARSNVFTTNGINFLNGGNVAFGSFADPVVRRGDKASIWNWAAAVSFPDLFKAGNVLGFIFGMPPRVASNDYGTNFSFPSFAAFAPRRIDANATYHVEAFYKFQLTDNLSITPGAFVVINPEGNRNNPNIYVGTIRATFTF